MKQFIKIFALSLLVFAFTFFIFADFAKAAENETASPHGLGSTLLWIAIILITAKISSLVEKIGQPSVLGELITGVTIGNLALIGINFFEPIKSDIYISFLAELGVIFLLFQVGLESNVKEMQKVGSTALLVAIIGVAVPFILGTYVAGPLLLPGLDFNAYLFLGAALTATSVGITARVFKDLDKLKTKEAQIVLGAAVIDDVIGLIILAVVSAIVTIGAISIGAISWIIGKAILFLAGSIILGQLLATTLGKSFSKINTGVAMKFSLAASFALVFSFLAQEIGLAPIIGGFAAGLVLDPVHFKFFRKPKFVDDLLVYSENLQPSEKEKIDKIAHKYSHQHIEDLIEPISNFLVPIFFVVTGMSVRLETLFDPKVLLISIGITIVAFGGKCISGLAAKDANKAIIGFGMAPRGEVGLIFATIGKSLGVVSDEVFSILIVMVLLTTLLTPPVLNYLIKQSEKEKAAL